MAKANRKFRLSAVNTSDLDGLYGAVKEAISHNGKINPMIAALVVGTCITSGCLAKANELLEKDSDKDGLSDEWEENGPYKKHLDKNRQDVLIEVDFYENCGRQIELSDEAIQRIKAYYSKYDINMLFDVGGFQPLDGGERATFQKGSSECIELTFDDVLKIAKKEDYLEKDKKRYFHYVAILNKLYGASKTTGGQGEQPGNIFILTYTTDSDELIHKFHHEFGHNTGLSHTNSKTVMHGVARRPMTDNYFSEQEMKHMKEEGLRLSLTSHLRNFL